MYTSNISQYIIFKYNKLPLAYKFAFPIIHFLNNGTTLMNGSMYISIMFAHN